VAAVEREAAEPGLLGGLVSRGPHVLRGRDTPIELWVDGAAPPTHSRAKEIPR